MCLRPPRAAAPAQPHAARQKQLSALRCLHSAQLGRAPRTCSCTPERCAACSSRVARQAPRAAAPAAPMLLLDRSEGTQHGASASPRSEHSVHSAHSAPMRCSATELGSSCARAAAQLSSSKHVCSRSSCSPTLDVRSAAQRMWQGPHGSHNHRVAWGSMPTPEVGTAHLPLSSASPLKRSCCGTGLWRAAPRSVQQQGAVAVGLTMLC